MAMNPENVLCWSNVIVGALWCALLQAVPFLYELRVLLDWTAAATSLTWYQWLKLEDIRASLFLDEVRAAGRASRALGERVPRWQKFLQVSGWVQAEWVGRV
jgi:hypothetical protein